MGNKKLIFKRVKWSSDVAANLARATAPDSEAIAHEVKQGISQVWHIKDHGYMVTRFELEPIKTLVLVAGQGKKMADVLKVVPDIARANKAQQIRIHSRRAGMVRMLEKLSYTVVYGLGENTFYKKV